MLTDVGVAIKELELFKKAGGDSLVDLTLPGIGRDVLAMKKISEVTGVNVVAATGWYVASSHPPLVRQKGVEELREIMVRELVEGIDETGIRAGVIGEIGCSSHLHSDEKKALQAAAQAQRQTEACLFLHITSWNDFEKIQIREGQTYLDVIEKEGGNLDKVVMGHMDSYNRDEMPPLGVDLDYHRSLLSRGITIAYDSLGKDLSWKDHIFPGASYPSDRERIAAIVELCKQGYDKQILLSQDICMKTHLTMYGGYGYVYILKYLIPALKYAGVRGKQIRNIMVKNPERLLSF